MDDVETGERFSSARDASNKTDCEVARPAGIVNLSEEHISCLIEITRVPVRQLANTMSFVETCCSLDYRGRRAVRRIQPLLWNNRFGGSLVVIALNAQKIRSEANPVSPDQGSNISFINDQVH